MKTATSERLIEMTVKPIWRAPFSAACKRRLTFLDEAHNVFDHDDGVVDDEAGRNGQCHERQIVEAVTAQPHHAESAGKRERHGDARR